MTATIACPACTSPLRVGHPVPTGKVIKCPRCAAAFRLKLAAPAAVAVAPAARPADTTPPAAVAAAAPAVGEKKPPRKRPREDEDERERGPLVGLLVGGVLLLLLVGCGVAAFLILRQEAEKKAADTTYTIQIKSVPDEGKEVAVKSTRKAVSALKFYDAAGKLQQEFNPTESEEDEYTETVLEKGGLYPKKLKRVYTKASVTTNGAGQTAEKTEDRPYHNRIVLFELQGAAYQVRAEGNPALRPAELAPLTKEGAQRIKNYDLNQVLLPEEPIKVGQTWDVDPARFASSLDNTEIDAAASKGQGKLVRVYQKGGKQFGVLEVELQLHFKAMPGLRFDPPAPGEVKLTADAAIDGSSVQGISTWSLKFSGRANKTAQGHAEVTIEESGSTERSEEK